MLHVFVNMLFNRAVTSIGYCHVDRGCKIAIHHLPGANGIARSNENTFFVGSTTRAEVRVLERQSDDLLVVSDVITYGSAFMISIGLFVSTDPAITETAMAVDNLSMDGEGAVWAAAFPSGKDLFEHLGDPLRYPSPSIALRIAFTAGDGPASFGKDYSVDMVSCRGLNLSVGQLMNLAWSHLKATARTISPRGPQQSYMMLQDIACS
jgi:arylesterase/paraoxonase